MNKEEYNNKEKLFKKLEQKRKRFSIIDKNIYLFPLVSAPIVLILSMFFLSGSNLIYLFMCLSGFLFVDGFLSGMDKGLTSFIIGKKYDKIENEYYKLGEELGYFIQDENGKYYNREFLEDNQDNEKYAQLLQEIAYRQTMINPSKSLDYELSRFNKPKKEKTIIFSKKSITAYDKSDNDNRNDLR